MTANRPNIVWSRVIRRIYRCGGEREIQSFFRQVIVAFTKTVIARILPSYTAIYSLMKVIRFFMSRKGWEEYIVPLSPAETSLITDNAIGT